MQHLIYIPQVTRQRTHCKLVEWCADVGKRVDVGDHLLIFETHKATVQLEAAVKGILTQKRRRAGEWARVGEPVGVIDADPGSAIADSPVRAKAVACRRPFGTVRM